MIVPRWLPQTCYSPSLLVPEGILIHFISAKYTRPEKPFDPDACYSIFLNFKVSAHYMILRDGEIWSLVPEANQAWHAGKSRFRGEDGLNPTFFGIEFIGDGETEFTDSQYREGAFLVADLMKRYRIPTNNVKGHEQVSGHKVRSDAKEDPGPLFDWLRFGAALGA